jgi:hypothetical protein
MGKRGPKPTNETAVRTWVRLWKQAFRYLRDGLEQGVIETLDPDYMKLKREQVGPDHFKIGPVKQFQPHAPTGPIRFGSTGRLRRTWAEVPDAERRKLSTPVDFVMLRIPAIPPDGSTYSQLLRAKTVRRVRTICRRSRYWQPLKSKRCRFLYRIDNKDERMRAYQELANLAGIIFPRLQDVYNHADRFLLAKSDRRFPASNRPTSDKRRMHFMACAMAGVNLRRSLRTTLDKSPK